MPESTEGISEDVLKKLLASGVTADEILEKGTGGYPGCVVHLWDVLPIWLD